jgi:hypothetical protein
MMRITIIRRMSGSNRESEPVGSTGAVRGRAAIRAESVTPYPSAINPTRA